MMTGNSPFELQKESAVPLYIQLAEAVEKEHPGGNLSGRGRIPSEQDLIRTCRVSRVTVRLAMRHLFEKNLIVRKQGRGTFVRKAVISQPMDELFGYYPALLRKGLKPKIQILEYNFVIPDSEAQKKPPAFSGRKYCGWCGNISWKRTSGSLSR